METLLFFLQRVGGGYGFTLLEISVHIMGGHDTFRTNEEERRRKSLGLDCRGQVNACTRFQRAGRGHDTAFL